MEYSVQAIRWNNRFGSRMCPCGCYNKSPYTTSYTINVRTNTMQGYGNPLVESIVVWCDDCGAHDIYTINDGHSRVNDYDIR